MVKNKEENILQEFSDTLDFNLDNKKDIEYAVNQLLDELKYLQLGNLTDEQLNLMVRLVSHNELRMYPFKKIYERNKQVIKQIIKHKNKHNIINSSVYFLFALIVAFYESTNYETAYDRVKIFIFTIYKSFVFLFIIAEKIFGILSIPVNLLFGAIRTLI